MSIKPQSSNTTGRDQVDIGIKNQRNEDNCAQFAIRYFKVNGQKITTAQFAAEQFIIFIFSSLEEIYHHHNSLLSA
ncbi:hypothetical protein [Type-E symbiont of Plautia stali]|uniref:hypothetical protein n=1 Tax=Type-E symbiont of Plautia stali TaxID=1560357 RepID=UPI001428CAE9|nr:hypothetical protein [Type-E symbiont of Plautia stali]